MHRQKLRSMLQEAAIAIGKGSTDPFPGDPENPVIVSVHRISYNQFLLGTSYIQF